jgi:hypothetical protein
MGLLSGQTTTLLEGDCYNYLMNQFCEDVYFEISAHHPNRDLLGVINMYTMGHIIGGDMAYYMQRIFNKAPEGFQDYLIQNDYIKVEQVTININEFKCNYYDPIAVAPPAIKHDGNYRYFLPDVQTEDYYLYFKWKLKELFWQYDEISHINDVVIINDKNL